MLNDVQYPTLIRRMMALVYDSLILASICFLSTAIAIIFTKGHAIAPNNLLFKCYLLSMGSCFTLWFWTHGGQTTGMAAWRIKLVNYANEPISNKQAILRLCLAIPLGLCGLGFIWVLIDRDQQALYDRLAKTKLVLIPVKEALK